MNTVGIAHERLPSPREKRQARDAAREGGRVRRSAIKNAMLAGWAGEDADEANWLDEAASAHPGPDAAIRTLYGLAKQLVDRLVEVTGEEREQVLERCRL